MADLFVGQGLIDLILDTSLDLSSATSLAIHYEKPSGTDGSFTGALYETTKIRYLLDNSDIDEVGIWKFQSVAVISGRNGYGDVVELNFKPRLTTL